MALRKGKCTLFGDCSVADSSKVVDVPDGSDFVCPECHRRLVAIVEPSRVPKLKIAAAAIVPLLAAVAVFVYVTFQKTKVPPDNAEPTPRPTLSAPEPAPAAPILRLHGSNTIGAALAPEIVKAFFATRGANFLRTVTLGADENDLEFEQNGNKQTVEIFSKGSATAFPDLAGRLCDIGMASRQIKPKEVQDLMDAGLGDMTSPGSENVLGLDGIAVVVNPGNPIESLAKAQLGEIFTGRMTDWSQVGGTSGPIQVYARDDKSGTFDTFKNLVLAGAQLLPLAEKYRFENSAALDDAVASNLGGIGFIGLPYAIHSKKIAVSEQGAEPLLPTPFTVATEDYPISRRLYLYVPVARASALARAFVDFALSPDGQKVVAQVGFIPLIIRAEKVQVPSKAPPRYIQILGKAERLNLDFRFRTASDQLDNKALPDLNKVVSFLERPENHDSNIILLGFADNKGGNSINCPLSKRRAEAVKLQLWQRGIHPEVVSGFCSSLPVADNSTDEGREKNRRVEIWMAAQD